LRDTLGVCGRGLGVEELVDLVREKGLRVLRLLYVRVLASYFLKKSLVFFLSRKGDFPI